LIIDQTLIDFLFFATLLISSLNSNINYVYQK
jgi:hypothetical protein